MVVEWYGVGEVCEGSSDGQAPILLSCLETRRFCRTGCRHKSARFQRHPFIIPANDNVRSKDRLSARYGSLLRRLIALPSTRTMTNVVRSSLQAASHELIAKLVKAGYLRPALCNDADAVTAAIAQLKQDLRAGVTAAPPDADHSLVVVSRIHRFTFHPARMTLGITLWPARRVPRAHSPKPQRSARIRQCRRRSAIRR